MTQSRTDDGAPAATPIPHLVTLPVARPGANGSRGSEPSVPADRHGGEPPMPQRSCCCRALPTELRRRTTELVGPPTNLADRAPIGFTAVMDGNCALTVSLNDACGLDDVYELCEQITEACLHEDTGVTFTRAQPLAANP